MTDRPTPSWSTARNLAQLGELTARWLEGDLDEHPCYLGPPDEETAPLVTTLAAVNRAGLITDFSQPGHPEDKGWIQRAAVTGFCSNEIKEQLATAVGPTDLLFLAEYNCARSALRIPVTIVDGAQYTWVGGAPDGHPDEWFPGVHPDGTAELYVSWYVTILDPVWARDDVLWSTLIDAVTDAR